MSPEVLHRLADDQPDLVALLTEVATDVTALAQDPEADPLALARLIDDLESERRRLNGELGRLRNNRVEFDRLPGVTELELRQLNPLRENLRRLAAYLGGRPV